MNASYDGMVTGYSQEGKSFVPHLALMCSGSQCNGLWLWYSMVVVDSIYSTDSGRNLQKICTICNRFTIILFFRYLNECLRVGVYKASSDISLLQHWQQTPIPIFFLNTSCLYQIQYIYPHTGPKVTTCAAGCSTVDSFTIFYSRCHISIYPSKNPYYSVNSFKYM